MTVLTKIIGSRYRDIDEIYTSVKKKVLLMFMMIIQIVQMLCIEYGKYDNNISIYIHIDHILYILT